MKNKESLTILQKLLRFFVKNHKLAYLFTVLVLLSGIVNFNSINRNMFPDVEFDETIITTALEGASPEDIEINITNKIEKVLNGISGIKSFTSRSMKNLSMIRLELDPDISDKKKIQNKIKDAIANVEDLPQNASTPLIRDIDTSIFPVIELAVFSEDYKLARESALIIEKKLARLAEISKVEKGGFLEQEVLIELSPKKLKQFDIPIQLVANKIKASKINTSLGSIYSKNKQKTLTINTSPSKKNTIENIVIRSTFEGKLIKLKDIATIKKGLKEEESIARINGKQGVGLVAFKKENADVIETIKKIKKFVENEKKTLPKNLNIVLYNDMSIYLSNRLKVTFTNGLAGLLLVLISLAIFLKIRAAFWVALGIPVSLLGVFIFLPSLDQTLNIVSTTSLIIVLGIIVDDAIVISENILQKRQEGMDPIDAAIYGTSEVFKPVISTIITTFIAFAPMFNLPGDIGKFIVVIPTVISIALLISFIEVCFALPAHIAPTLKNVPIVKNKDKDRFFTFKNKVAATLEKWLTYRLIIIIGIFVFFLCSLFVAKNFMTFNLFPRDNADTMFIKCEFPKDYSLEKTSEEMRKVEKVIESIDPTLFNSYKTQSGLLNGYNSEIGDKSTIENNTATITLYLTPFTKRDIKAITIANNLREKLKKLPQLSRFEVELESGGPPVGKDLKIKIIDDNDIQRKNITNQIHDIILTIPGIKEIKRSDDSPKKQLKIIPNPTELARSNITNDQLASQIAIAFLGAELFKIKENGEEVTYTLKLAKKNRRKIKNILDLPIANNQNRLIPLKKIATIKEVVEDKLILHDKTIRYTDISAGIDTRKNNSVNALNYLKKEIKKLPLNTTQIIYSGEAAEIKKSQKDITNSFIIAVIGIYFVLIILFNSFTQPFIVICCIPLGIMGVIISLFIHQESLGFFAGIGTVGLTGVLVNDALILLFRINQLKKLFPEKHIKKIAAQASSDRLRAIFLTTLTTVIGITPLAYGLGGKDPFLIPLALALGYGLLFSTPLILILVPALYLLLEDLKKIFKSTTKVKDFTLSRIKIIFNLNQRRL